MPFVADPQWFLQPNLPRQGYLENTASVVWLTGMIYDVSSEPWLAYRPAQVLYMSAYHESDRLRKVQSEVRHVPARTDAVER